MKSLPDIDALYRTHGHSVLRRARQILGPGHDAEDALQEIFASLLARPEQFSGRSAPSTFLYSMTTNHCLTRLRNTRTRLRLLEGMGPKQGESSNSSTSEGERAVLVRQFLRQLPESLQEVTVYAYVDEMTQQEMAEVMGCSRRHIVNLLAKVSAHAKTFEAQLERGTEVAS